MNQGLTLSVLENIAVEKAEVQSARRTGTTVLLLKLQFYLWFNHILLKWNYLSMRFYSELF